MSSNTNRILALGLALCCLCWAVPAQAARRQAKPKPKPALAQPAAQPDTVPAAETAQPVPPSKAAPQRIELNTKLRLLIRPTLMGLVPPDDPEDYGEIMLRVVRIADAALSLRYEIKERVPREVAVKSVFAAAAEKEEAAPRPGLVPQRRPRQAPEDAPATTKVVESTRIRRGLIEARRDATVNRGDPPLFWDDGDWATNSGALWLSSAGYAQLVASGSLPWEPLPAVWVEAPALDELRAQVAGLRQARGLSADAPVNLELKEREARFPCYVNGEQTTLPCLIAIDSLGLAQYWILTDEQNPLILKLTYLAGAGTQAGVLEDAGTTAAPEAPASGAAEAQTEAETAPAPPADTAAPVDVGTTPQDTGAPAGSDPRRPKLKLRERRQPADAAEDTPAQLAPAEEVTAPGTPAGEPPAVPGSITAGGGYAVVEINF